MPIKVRIDAGQRVVYRKVTGTVTIEDLLASFMQTLQHPDYRTGMSSFNDLREAVATGFSSEVRKIGEFLADKGPQTGAARAAIVVSNDAMYGMSRALQAFAQNSPMDIQIFRDLQEARAWLGLEPE